MKHKKGYVLGCFDPATRTGYAIYKGQKLTEAGYACFRKLAKLPYEQRLAEYAKWISDFISVKGIDTMVVEYPLPHQKNINAAKLLYGYCGVLIATAYCNKIPIHGYAPKNIKLWATGQAYAHKEVMRQKWIIKYGLIDDAINDDALDAMWLGKYYLSLI